MYIPSKFNKFTTNISAQAQMIQMYIKYSAAIIYLFDSVNTSYMLAATSKEVIRCTNIIFDPQTNAHDFSNGSYTNIDAINNVFQLQLINGSRINLTFGSINMSIIPYNNFYIKNTSTNVYIIEPNTLANILNTPDQNRMCQIQSNTIYQCKFGS